MIKCKMKVERIMFPKDKKIESGDFAIFVASIVEHQEGERPVEHRDYGTVSLKGNVPSLKVGDVFTFILKDAEVNKYGTSYTIADVDYEIDTSDKEQVKNFLKIICGEGISKELMKLDNPYELIKSRDTDALLKVKGIAEKKLEKIYDNFDMLKGRSVAYAKLEPLGISRKLINKLCKHLGGSASAIDYCFNNPYKIVDKVKGVGFLKADEIAQKCGYFNPTLRLRYAILHVLETNGESGRSYLFANQLVHEVGRITPADFNDINSAIMYLVEKGKVSLSADGNKVALNYYIELESNIAKRIKELVKAKTHIEIPSNWKEIVEKIEEKQGWKYTDEQMDGIKACLNSNVVVIRGLAGTGKSTVTNAMCEVLDQYKISMCCLSAKASQRLREVTQRDAQTIHRLLGMGMGEVGDVQEIYSDIIILDEASMVNGTIFLALLKAIREGSKLIILGDNGQLTSIGNCAVFNDLLNCKSITVVELTQIHRQALKSAIITESINARMQKPIYERTFRGHRVLGELQDLELFIEEESDNLMELIKNKFIEDLSVVNNIMEVQIITPVKNRGEVCVNKINLEIQQIYNNLIGKKSFKGQDDVLIFEGDKIINLKNNYSSKDVNGESKPVWNGSIGKVVNIQEDCVIIDFVGIGEVVIEKCDYSNINLGYAISCHSSQGSQWERVIIGMDTSAYVLLNVEILYTAITRARLNCSLIANHRAINMAMGRVEQSLKQTLLPEFL